MLNVPPGYQSDWLHYQLLIWADAEVGLAIFCSSVAALRPLMRVMGGHSLSNINRLSSAAYGRTPDPELSGEPSLGSQTKHQGFVASVPAEGLELTHVGTHKDGRNVAENEKQAPSLRDVDGGRACH